MTMSSWTITGFLSICFCIPLFFRPPRPVAGAVGPAISPEKATVKVGVVIDKSSMVGELASTYMDMALPDFYDEHESYRTRLSLRYRDPKNDVVAAASAAVDLIENEEVDAIIGPEWSSQAKFVIELGSKARVPIVSFSATCPLLSPAQEPYFVRTAYDDSSQIKAIAAIVQAFGWREVVPIYEDSDYGNGLIPYITDAFQEIDARVPYRSMISPLAKDIDILNELIKVMNMQTRVFLVHMTARLGSRVFMIADKAGMLNEETSWIVTDGLTSLLDPIGARAMKSMQGVIGVRPYLPTSKRLTNFKRKNSLGTKDANLFALWAYDTVWALADAVEKAWNSSSSGYNLGRSIARSRTNKTSPLDFSAIGISEFGPVILRWLRNSGLDGLTGYFKLVKGQLRPSAFEIFNVIERNEEVIGYWVPKYGLCSKVSGNFTEQAKGYSTSKHDLKPPIWPGGTRQQPKGWVVPVGKEKKMRFGVPFKGGFTEFFKIVLDPRTQVPTYSGFSYDVFLEVLKRLPFAIPYEFVPFMNQSYDEMLYQIELGRIDAFVGDTTIVANRSNFVDFALPYSESGVSMVVAIKDDERRNMWVFLKPLKWDLWLTTGLAFVFTGFIVWVLERRKNEEFNGSKSEQVGLSLWFSFSTLVFAHRERVVNNLTRVVLVVWVFVVLIITQSYTASLASFLTVQRLQPKYVDVDDLVKNQLYVGYQEGSFVKDLLIQELNFRESRLRAYGSPEEYHEALSKGSGDGGVAAIFDEVPYIRLFLAKYCNRYTMVGPTYKTDGFGFAFTMRSPLVSYISRAVLNVTQDKSKMDAIERKNFLIGEKSSCRDVTDGDTAISSDLSLSLYSFGGLFIITAAVSVCAVMSELLYSIWCRFSSSSSASLGKYRGSDGASPMIWPNFLLKMLAKRSWDMAHLPRAGSTSRVVPLTNC